MYNNKKNIKIIEEKILPYGRQSIDENDIQEVLKILKADFITQGPTIKSFEDTVKTFCNANFSVALNSATSALHAACLSLELGNGDLFWTSANTFVSSANCGLLNGAEVDFVDIDPGTLNMSVNCLEEKLKKAKKINKIPKVVIPVHFAGQSCDMEAIHNLSYEYGFKIIEDASHAIGGTYKNIQVGSCIYSDITVFSFHPVKIITTGEGGMALTNSKKLAKNLNQFRSHGIHSNKSEMRFRPDDEIWNYQQVSLGLNYRMTDIAASLGLSQMQKLEVFVKKRQNLANLYDKALKGLPLTTQTQPNKIKSSFHLYPIRLDLSKTGKTQRKVYDELFEMGIAVNIHYIPVYRQPFYEDLGFKEGYCPEAENYFKEALSIPIFPSMSLEDHNRVVVALKRILL